VASVCSGALLPIRQGQVLPAGGLELEVVGAAAGQVELRVQAEQRGLVGRPAQLGDAQAGDVHAQRQRQVGWRGERLVTGLAADIDLIHRQLLRHQQAVAGTDAQSGPAQPAQFGRAAGPGQHQAAGAEVTHQRTFRRFDLNARQMGHQPGAAGWAVQQPGDEGRDQHQHKRQRDPGGSAQPQSLTHSVIPTEKCSRHLPVSCARATSTRSGPTGLRQRTPVP
jgi:hypothetical protein